MKFIKIFINTFLSLTLTVVITASMFLYCSKALISKENISKYVKSTDIINADIGTLFNRETSGVTLKQRITELAIVNGIPEDIVTDILKSDEINALLGDFFNQTALYIINGNNKPLMSQKTIDDMKLAAKVSLNNHINIMMDEEELDAKIEEYCHSISTIAPDRSETIGDLQVDKMDVIINFNPWYLYIAALVIILTLIIINKAIYKALKYLGISMLISGIIYIVFGSLDYLISNYILTRMSAMKPFISSLITNFLTICFKNGVLISFTSVILLLCFITINAITKD